MHIFEKKLHVFGRKLHVFGRKMHIFWRKCMDFRKSGRFCTGKCVKFSYIYIKNAIKFEILCPTVSILVFYISWAWSILFWSSPFWTCQIFIWSSFNKDMMFSSFFQISLTISLKLTVNYSQLCFRWCVFFYKNAPTETQFAAVNVSTIDT